MEEVNDNLYHSEIFRASFARPSNMNSTKIKKLEGCEVHKMIIKFIRLMGVQENGRCVLCGPIESLWTQ
jgi:hypothetical protein